MVASQMAGPAKKWPRIVVVASVLCGSAFAFLTWSISHPSVQVLPLPATLISLNAPEGREFRNRAEDRADLKALESHFEAQKYATYCGVASSVIALRTLGTSVSQDTFFDEDASAVRSPWATFYMGMTVDQLGDLLVAHGVTADVVHAGDTTVDDFRSAARGNLSRAGDVMLVNYERSVVEQGSGGHISPVGAYDATSDRFLVMDVSAYKYPPVWMSAAALFAAMNTQDAASGATRGYVLVGTR